MLKNQFLILLLIIPGFFGIAFGHTVDSVGDYRLEIGWMNEPVVSGETNGIELYVSPLEPGLSLEEQEFKNGVSGLDVITSYSIHYTKLYEPFVYLLGLEKSLEDFSNLVF